MPSNLCASRPVSPDPDSNPQTSVLQMPRTLNDLARSALVGVSFALLFGLLVFVLGAKTHFVTAYLARFSFSLLSARSPSGAPSSARSSTAAAHDRDGVIGTEVRRL